MLKFEIIPEEQTNTVEFLQFKEYIMTVREIEEKFIYEMYFSHEPFIGELSDKVLLELENGAVRTEKYGVKTREGDMSIACISAEAKFALLVIQYAKEYSRVRFVIDPAILKPEVFAWLNDNLDVTMYIPFLNMVEHHSYDLLTKSGINFIWNGEIIDNLLLWICRHNFMTKNSEREAFERRFHFAKILSFSPDGIPYGEFIRLFADKQYTPEAPDEYQSSYIVRAEQGQFCCEDIFTQYVCAFCVYDKKGVSYSKSLPIVKSPTIPDLLWDVLEFVKEKAVDRAIVVVTWPDESHLLRNYTEHIYFGLLIDGKNRTIDFLSQNVSAIMYHNALEKVDIPPDAPLRGAYGIR